MCNIWKIKPKNEVTLEEWRGVMKDNIFFNIRNLTISGGEPILYKDYVKAVKLFIDSMPKLRKLILNTNGFLSETIERTTVEIAKYCKLKKVKLVVNISIDGVGKVHDDLRQIKNGFEACLDTVKRLRKISRKNGFSLGVSSIILRQNVTRYKEMKRWLLDNNLKGGFQIVGFHDSFLRNTETKKNLSIDKTVKSEFLKVLVDIRETRLPWDVTRYYWEDMLAMYRDGKSRTTPCSFLKDDFIVDGLGDVYYCLSVRPIGNFIKENRSVGEIYFDDKNIKFRKNLPVGACKQCNSGCNVTNALAYDAKRYLWYRLSRRLWPGKMLNVV